MKFNPPRSDSDHAKELLRRQRRLPPAMEEQDDDPPELANELRTLRGLIAKYGKQDGSERLLITPNMALAMLHLMRAGNRRMGRAWVERYKQVLLDGRFGTMPNQGMGFDWNGNFRDGQHRCAAIIETKIEVYVWVAFGVDPKLYAAQDTGNRRNAAQNIEIAGIAGGAAVAAVVRLQYRTSHAGALPDDQLVTELGIEMAGDLLDIAIHGARLLRADRGATVSSAALAYWLIATQSKHRKRLRDFWSYLVEGYDLPKDGTIFNLRRKFKTLPPGRKAHQYQSQTEQCGWIIIAWNAWVSDRVLTQQAIRWPNQNALPEVV